MVAVVIHRAILAALALADLDQQASEPFDLLGVDDAAIAGLVQCAFGIEIGPNIWPTMLLTSSSRWLRSTQMWSGATQAWPALMHFPIAIR